MIKTLKILSVTIILIFALIGMAFTFVFFGMQQGVLNVRGSIKERNTFFKPVATTSPDSPAEPQTNGCVDTTDQLASCDWNETTEWTTVRDGLTKDTPIIRRVSEETGVPARMIAAAVVPEQVRFFTDNREVFKRYFEPLKILASLSKFSLGVSGIKQETANAIESHAMSTSSDFYPGDSIAPLIAYSEGADHDAELFKRLTDEKDHYYSYLYTAIYLKQIEAQWKKAGYDVSNRPDVLVTLFNLGFAASEPKANPQVAGSNIVTGGQSYSFGYLGTLFYESTELRESFPKN